MLVILALQHVITLTRLTAWKDMLTIEYNQNVLYCNKGFFHQPFIPCTYLNTCKYLETIYCSTPSGSSLRSKDITRAEQEGRVKFSNKIIWKVQKELMNRQDKNWSWGQKTKVTADQKRWGR